MVTDMQADEFDIVARYSGLFPGLQLYCARAVLSTSLRFECALA